MFNSPGLPGFNLKIMSLDKAKAAYKKIFNQDAPDDFTKEQINQAITKAKADAKAEAEANKPKYKVHFGVEITETKKVYTKEEIESNPEICAYLVEIGSGAVEKL